MGTALTGSSVASTYDALLKITDNGPVGATAKTVTDGLGNDSALKLGTAGIEVAGSASVSNGISITGSANGFDAFTIAQSSSNSVGLRIQNSYAGSNNWNISSSGGGPAANGSFVIYDDTGGAVAMTIAKTTRAAAFAGTLATTAGVAWNLGAANSVSPTSPNRTLTVTVAGTTYYIHAKTTND